MSCFFFQLCDRKHQATKIKNILILLSDFQAISKQSCCLEYFSLSPELTSFMTFWPLTFSCLLVLNEGWRSQRFWVYRRANQKTWCCSVRVSSHRLMVGLSVVAARAVGQTSQQTSTSLVICRGYKQHSVFICGYHKNMSTFLKTATIGSSRVTRPGCV